MKIFKRVILLIVLFISLIITSYLVFMYYFTKSPGAIAEYTFPEITYDELEITIKKETNRADTVKEDNYMEIVRYVTLGKDSSNYYFYTNIDRDKSSKYKNPWVELIGVSDSNRNDLNIYHSNRHEHLDRIEIFEKYFINKIKNP